MKRENPALRRALATAFWLLVWQLLAMTVGQPILLASPTATLPFSTLPMPMRPTYSL